MRSSATGPFSQPQSSRVMCPIMGPLQMRPPEIYKRLIDTFPAANSSIRGVVEDEDEVGRQLAQQFPGQYALMDAFQGFYIDTLDFVRRDIANNGWPKGAPYYSVAWLYHSNLFRRFRACENLVRKGYPLDGYALMRDIKDRALMLAGIAHNIATFPQIMGAVELPPPTDRHEYGKKSTKIRKDTEQRVTHRLMGKNSGLAPDIQSELTLWDTFFHYELHGGGVTLTTELAAIARGAAPNIGPTFNHDSFAMYINRSSEIGWFLLRLLPYLQIGENAFGDEWHAKYAILDDTFRFMVRILTSLGKNIGEALIVLVDEKFAFKQPFHYREADGSA